MGTKERRDRERRELRQAILAAARDIAARDGWQAVTIRRVAERIEYSPPTIYEHFDGKEALLLELMREGYRRLFDTVRAATDRVSDPAARVLALAHGYWAFAWANPELYQVMHGLGGVPFCADAPAALAGKHPPEAEEVFAFTVAAIDDLAPARESSQDDLEMSVVIFWSTLHGLVALAMAGRLKVDREQAEELVERAVRDFLLARGILPSGS